MNGNPHSAVFATNIHVDVIGAEFNVFPIHRRSWAWSCILIKLPAQMNNKALNRAWITI